MSIAFLKWIKKQPLNVSLTQIQFLTKKIDQGFLPKSVLNDTILDILNLVEGGIYKSDATDGLIGKLNISTNKARQKEYWSGLKSGTFTRSNATVVLAEGDSWFNHPFISDTLEQLQLESNIEVFSIASASDWLQSYIYKGEYIESLSLIKPNVFIVSGGGNDMLGGKKVTLFVNKQPDSKYGSEILAKYPSDDKEIQFGYNYLSYKFIAYLKVVQWSYFYMFSEIRKKYTEMPIITHGYAEVIPHGMAENPLISINYFYKSLLNYIQGSGKWLETPLKNSGSYSMVTMAKILKAMIHIFNENMIELAESNYFGNLYHIDNRGLASKKDWFDEIHLKSYKFNDFAKSLSHVINNYKVIAPGKFVTIERIKDNTVKRDSFFELLCKVFMTRNYAKRSLFTICFAFCLIILQSIFGFSHWCSWIYIIPFATLVLRRIIFASYVVLNR